MANIKFSAFTQKVVLGDVDFLVGYTGADNVRVAPSVFSGIYLPLAGGDMVGPTTHGDTVHSYWGNSNDIDIFHDGANSYIDDRGTGRLSIRASSSMWLRTYANEDYIKMTEGGSVELYYDNVKKFETASTGIVISGTNALNSIESYFDGLFTSGFKFSDLNGGIWYDASLDDLTLNAGHVNSQIILNSGGVTTMTLDASQNVGIGTASPLANLDVSNTAGTTYQQWSYDNPGANDYNLTLSETVTAGNVRFCFNQRNAGTTHSDVLVFNQGQIGIGTDDPASILHLAAAAATVFRVEETTNNATAAMYATATDLWMGAITNHPLKILTNDVTAITIDTSQDATFAGDVHIADAKKLLCGLSNDLQLWHAGGVGGSYIDNYVGNLYINNYANDADIVFASDDGSGGVRTYLYLDGSQAAPGDACWTIWPDNSRIGIGDSKDLQIHHELGHNYITQTVGNLYINNTANDKDIIFQSDDGVGGITEYFRVDGGAVKTIASKNFAFLDDVKAEFGDSGDLQIYHDASNSYISDTGTGSLIVMATNWNLNNSANTQNMMVAVDGGAVSLFNAGVQKFQTSSTGVIIAGQIQLSALNTAPASAGAAGTLGEIRYTADYIYVCTATNTWKRTAISTW